MERIVVGTDGSTGAARAVAWAADLARAHDAELIVASCARPDGDEERIRQEREAQLAEWAEAAGGGGLRLRREVLWGDARQRLAALADDEHADLLVVGRAGETCEVGPGLLQLNSTPEYLAHHAEEALAVVAGEHGPGIRRLLVGVDGSDNARAAVRWTAQTARVTGAEVVVAAVGQPILEWSRSDSPRNWRRHVEKLVREDWAAELFQGEGEVELRVLRGSRPADALTREANRASADVLVLGLRGVGGFAGLRIGGVALRALHKARTTVVLVPAKG
jgi:nucleotide-binding universal stress UspA family protein